MKNNMKVVFISVISSIFMAVPCFASPYAAPVIEKNDYTTQVNGTWLQNPIYENKDHAHMYPLREVCELLGYDVVWEPTTKKITVTGDNIIAECKSGESSVLVDGDMVFELRAEIENKNGMTYVPSLFFTNIFPINMTNEPNEVILVEKQTNQVTATITDATMNTLSVQTAEGTYYTFDTSNADKSKCNGLTIGSEVTIFYKGNLYDNTEVVALEQTLL